MKRKIGFILLIIIVVIQFIKPDTSVPEYNESEDFFNSHVATAEVKNLIVAACYDCHSYKTKYPIYSRVAPISWWLADHIEEGREHLNFSKWSSYSEKKAKHKLEECFEELEEKEMPLEEYTWLHSDANLSEDQREMLIIWFKSQYDLPKAN